MNIYLPGTRLPSAYQEVEYIQCTGSGSTGQFIRTGFVANQDTSVEIKASTNVISGENGCFFCSRVGGADRTFSVFRLGSVIRQDYNTTQQQTNRTMSTGTAYTIKADKNKLYVDGTLVQTLSYGTFSGTYPMTLLGSYTSYYQSSSYNNMWNGRLYYCKIRDNGTLVRNFVPCYRKSDSVIGLYDTVNNVFYTNQGSGSFTKGSNITKLSLYKCYIGEKSLYNFEYDFTNKTLAQIQSDGWNIFLNSSLAQINSYGFGINSSGTNVNTMAKIDIGNKFVSAKKITIEYTGTLLNNITTGFRTFATATSSSRTGTTGPGMDMGLFQTNIYDTGYPDTSTSNYGRYTLSTVIDLSNKTRTSKSSDGRTKTGTLTDSQVSNIRNNTSGVYLIAGTTDRGGYASGGVEKVKINVQ